LFDDTRTPQCQTLLYPGGLRALNREERFYYNNNAVFAGIGDI